MSIERSPQFQQLALFPGHEPEPVVSTASRWARTVAGRGAKVRYTPPTPVESRQNGAIEDHVLAVTVPGQRDPVGHLAWDERQGVVNGVYVKEEYRRRGLARGLWNIAKAFGNDHPDEIAPVKHSPVQLPHGKVWAQAVGD